MIYLLFSICYVIYISSFIFPQTLYKYHDIINSSNFVSVISFLCISYKKHFLTLRKEAFLGTRKSQLAFRPRVRAEDRAPGLSGYPHVLPGIPPESGPSPHRLPDRQGT